MAKTYTYPERSWRLVTADPLQHEALLADLLDDAKAEDLYPSLPLRNKLKTHAWRGPSEPLTVWLRYLAAGALIVGCCLVYVIFSRDNL